MGRIRGKRNRDQDRYWHERRKQTQAGLVDADIEATATCEKCHSLAPRHEMHNSWCLSCVGEWVGTVDPWLIYQAQSQLPTEAVQPSTIRQMEQLRALVSVPLGDDDFLPLTQFHGRHSIGALRSMWNFVRAMYLFELDTTGETLRIGIEQPHTIHVCGRHAPVQRMGLQGFLSRVFKVGEQFKPFSDKRLVDYLRGFISDNRLFLFDLRRSSVDVFDRARTRRVEARIGQAHFDKRTPSYWPFEGGCAAHSRERGELEELPDVVMQIGELVETHSMPNSLREDVCQDLVVAVLSGEISVDDLRIDKFRKRYIREAFRHHPLKYGRYSIDGPAPWDNFKGQDYYIVSDDITQDDISPQRADRGWLADLCVDPDEHPKGWHDGRERLKGLATVGVVAREKHGGHAVEGPQAISAPEEMDEEIAEVYAADQDPRWRRRYSD